MADVDFRHDAGLGSVTGPQRLGKSRSLALLHQIDGATAKASASKPRADQSRQILRQGNHGIGLNATAFEVPAVAGMSLGHQPAKLLHIAAQQRLRSGYSAQVFADQDR